MNWCKFGIHDNEIIDDGTEVHTAFHDFMVKKGFKLESGIGHETWINSAGIKMYVHSCTEKAIPISTITTVCIICGRVKKNYSIERMLSTVQMMIDTKEYEAARKRAALDIRAAAKVRETYKLDKNLLGR
jgi:hypothetical protein